MRVELKVNTPKIVLIISNFRGEMCFYRENRKRATVYHRTTQKACLQAQTFYININITEILLFIF